MDPEYPENFVVEGFYRDVLGEFSNFKNKTLKGTCSHWVVPNLNLNSHISSTHVPFDSRFKYKINRPKPFMPPSDVNVAILRRGDPLEAIIQEKQLWQNELDVLVRVARKAKKWSNKQKFGLATGRIKKKDKAKPIYTVDRYVSVAKHIAKDPCPYFSGEYNWLASGGCISKSIAGEEHIILCPTGKHMNSLCLVGLEQHGERFTLKKTQPIVCSPLSGDQRIYQIESSQIENKCIACIRQEKVCSVVRIKQGIKKPLVSQVLLEIQANDCAFTSLDSNPLEDYQLCTLDSDKFLKLWDLHASSCVASVEIPAASDLPGWGFTKFSEKSNNLFVANSHTVFVKDQRMPLTNTALEFSPRALVDDCERISCMMNSLNSSLLYIGTSHHLLSLDLRVGWNQRWTHLLQAPPMFGSVFNNSRKLEETVLLSSSIPDDIVAISNTWKHGQPESSTFPIGLPSLGDCLLIARAHGECLRPAFSRRIEMATAGLALLNAEGSESFTCLRATSIGDVFSQDFQPMSEMYDMTEISQKKQDIESDIEEWVKWEKNEDSIGRSNNADLACPSFPNDTIFNTVRAPLDQKKKSDVEKWHKAFPKRKHHAVEKDSTDYHELLCDLGSYKDLMAGVLLQAWDTQGLTAPLEARDYVECWLDSCSASSSPPRDNDNLSGASTPMKTPRLMSSFRGTRFEPDFNVDEEPVFKVPLTPTSKPPPKKKKRESQGF